MDRAKGLLQAGLGADGTGSVPLGIQKTAMILRKSMREVVRE